ncbi:MAG: hypothetical protein KIT43_12665 [Bauldia sp.]|nr:hypothetical protein [Bauldia sp.]
MASAWLLPRWTAHRPPSARLAASIAVLSGLTVGFGAFALFVAVAVLQSSRWGAPFSLEWIGSMIVNSGASLVYTIALGLPMLIPLGIPVMFLGAWQLARLPRLSAAAAPVRPRASNEPEGPAS